MHCFTCLMVWLILLLLTSQAVALPNQVPAPKSANVPRIGLWYTAWWDEADQFGHWADTRDRVKKTPSLGHYSAADPAIIRSQYQQMRDCGVEFIIFDDTNTIHVDDNIIDRNIRAWFDFMDALPVSHRLLLCVAFGGELNQHADKQSFRESVDYLWKTFAQRPSYLHLEGKPFAPWYIEKDVYPDWHDDRFTIRKCFHFLRTGDQAKTQGWGWGSHPFPPDNSECMSFFPGWQLGNDPGVPRHGGDYYEENWVRVLKAAPKFTVIADWNNWQEQTALEDSPDWQDSYGYSTPDWYRQITTAYAALRGHQLLTGNYYRDEAEPAVYYCTRGHDLVHVPAFPHRKPVIIVPQGWLDGVPKLEWTGKLEPK